VAVRFRADSRQPIDRDMATVHTLTMAARIDEPLARLDCWTP
jgi:hypothetical protein